MLAARDVLDVAIVRPSQVYGRTGWIWSAWWGPLLEAKKSKTTKAIEIPSKVESRPAIIHVDDVVSGLHAVTDRIHGLLGSWPVIDLIGETVLVRDVMEGTKAVLGVEAPLSYIGSHNPFHEALNVVANERSSRAKILLGWEAKRQSFILDLPVYVKAWEAAQE